mgnify:CR=1 FL=1
MSTSATRADGRQPAQLRPITFEADIAPHATGSVLVSFGRTRVICAATVEPGVWVGPDARVTGDSRVLGTARIEDFAAVHDSTVRDAAVMTASAALVVAGREPGLRQGVTAAQRAIDSGAAESALTRLIKVSND